MDTNLFSWISDTLLVGVIAGAVAIWGISTQRHIARQRVTFDWVFSMIDNQGWMGPHSRSFSRVVAGPDGLIGWYKSGKKTQEENHSVEIILNLYESYAVGVSSGVIDYEIFLRLCSETTLRHWQIAQPYILQLRKDQNNPSLGLEFEILADRIAGTGKFPKNRSLGFLKTIRKAIS